MNFAQCCKCGSSSKAAELICIECSKIIQDDVKKLKNELRKKKIKEIVIAAKLEYIAQHFETEEELKQLAEELKNDQ